MTDAAPRRASSMAEMHQIQARMGGPKDIGGAIQSWRPRASDIVVSPFGKCGTTWLQQTFHTLRTRGDMDFDDISRVVPWIEMTRIVGLDLEAPQRAEPRGFKSHLPYDALPRGARAVVSLRDPKDALVSMYRFMEGWFFEPGAISITDFACDWLDNVQPAAPTYWHHLLSWWAERDNPEVLLLSYADMTENPEANVRRLAAFCGIELDDSLLALTLDRSSLAFMLEHKDRFDDAMMRGVSEARCNLPAGSDSSKVRKGGVGGHTRELPPEIAEAMDAVWARIVTPATGFADFAALETALRARLLSR